MTLTIKLVAVLAFATISAAVPLTTFEKALPTEADYRPVQKTVQQSEETDSYQLYQTQLPIGLELPKQEPKNIQFYVPEPVSFLKAPQESQQPDYYQVPIPNEELVAPVDTEWNPSGDPIYYYEVPAIISKQEIPTTKEFPKKYNEDIHSKKKPYSLNPKKEVIFEPISAKQYEDKQIQVAKNFDQLAKKENQKLVKVLPSPKILVPRNKQSKDSTPKNSDSITQTALIVPLPTYYDTPTSTPTHSLNKNADSITVPSNHVETASGTFDTGLSGQLLSSLGIPSSASTHDEASPGERLEFHISGHDGPLSYKWGYDTGKGHNRLFRFEERDKEGIVKGHYGFYDEEGKLQVIHYDAHPHTGFHVADKE